MKKSILLTLISALATQCRPITIIATAQQFCIPAYNCTFYQSSITMAALNVLLHPITQEEKDTVEYRHYLKKSKNELQQLAMRHYMNTNKFKNKHVKPLIGPHTKTQKNRIKNKEHLHQHATRSKERRR